jgi:hypothetical protein
VNPKHEPVLLHIDEKCAVVSSTSLSAPGAKIPMGPLFQNEQPAIEVGHPVLARHEDGHIAAAWLEETGSSTGSTRLMLRVLGDKLCN